MSPCAPWGLLPSLGCCGAASEVPAVDVTTSTACGIMCPVVEEDSKETFRLLFETERGADITLLVGSDDARERIPAHSWVLSHKNDFFRTLLTGPMRNSSNGTFCFPDDNPTHFMHLIRWLYGCGCAAVGTRSALGTMQVAIKYLCPELVQHLVESLSKKLKPQNVLQILAWADQYSYNIAPSAPPLYSLTPPDDLKRKQKLYPSLSHLSSPRTRRRSSSATNPRRNSSSSRLFASSTPVEDPTESCVKLHHNCLGYLDANAVAVLSCEDLGSVSDTILCRVLERDTLFLQNESIVLDALHRWSSAQCRRQHMPLTLTGRRQVLGSQLLTIPRLLTLDPSDLDKMDLLYTKDEKDFVRQKIKKPNSSPCVPPLFRGEVERMAQRRCRSVSKNAHGNGLTKKNSKKDMAANLLYMIFLAID